MSQEESLQELAARMGVFIANRQAFPQEELLKYVGQWIAWSPDGTAIVAHSAESAGAVYLQLEANGHDVGQCCVSYVDDPDEVILGAASIFVDRSSVNGTPPSSTGDGTVKDLAGS